MSAPTQQLWAPGRRAGEAGRGAPLPGAPLPGTGSHHSAAAHAAPSRPSRQHRIARPRPVACGSELAPAPADASRRGVALLVVMAVTFAVVCGLVSLGQAAASLPEVPRETSVVRVGAGETVWDVAERVAPGSDVRAVTARILELNGMNRRAVEPGMPLRVPDGR